MENGLVIKSTGSWYTVKKENGDIVACKIRGKFRKQNIRTTNPVAVGDRVLFERQESGNTGIIKEIEDRENYIIRKSSNLSKHAHILAANLDQAILIASLAYPETYLFFIDRFLVVAEAYQIPAKLVFNKIDLFDGQTMKNLEEIINTYENVGYPCLKTSVVNEKNLDIFHDMLKNKTSLLVGNSGVGKSSLINSIDPGINLKTAEISSYHKSGKHTTTFAEMFPLSNGGRVIDTPGIKGFGLIDVDKNEIYHFFPEIFEKARECKYHNCLHDNEPGCAVKEAVVNGEISETRYFNYMSLLTEEEGKYR